MIRPLDGITVIALEHAIAAPLATRHLADQGARVIKIERPGVGDFARGYDTRARGLSSHFVWTNRSKESLTLDLKTPEGAGVLTALLGKADVLVQNLAPGAATRMGLGFETLHAAHPKLISCGISGYGPDGPETTRKAYDLLIQAEAGFLSVTGTQDVPSKAGISVADIAAGIYAYSNILAALIQRGRTGLGAQIDVSMLEALAEWTGYPMYYAMDGAEPPARTGASHATIFPYGPFRVADGEILMGIQNTREWEIFCAQILDAPELARDQRFDSNAKRASERAALTQIIETTFASWSAQVVIAKLEAAGIACARMNDMAGLWAHPQLAARDRWREVETPVGALPALLPPGGLAGGEARMDAVPALGAHTGAILNELGYDAATVADFAARGIV
jgi:itaconate CoA-transferase